MLSIPCLTLCNNTKRPVTITDGTNRLVDPEDVRAIVDAVGSTLASGLPAEGAARRPPLWGGQAETRIVDRIATWAHLQGRRV